MYTRTEHSYICTKLVTDAIRFDAVVYTAKSESLGSLNLVGRVERNIGTSSRSNNNAIRLLYYDKRVRLNRFNPRIKKVYNIFLLHFLSIPGKGKIFFHVKTRTNYRRRGRCQIRHYKNNLWLILYFVVTP